MAELQHGEFDLDGYIIGASRSDPVYVAGFDPGVSEVRDEDADNPVGDNTHFGRDYLVGPTWTFGFGVLKGSPALALQALGGLAAAWRSGSRKPGDESVLRYSVGGRVRRVYGRTRKWTPNPSYLWFTGYADASGEFKTSDSLHYDDELRSVQVGLLPGPSGDALLPSSLPMTFNRAGSRSGMIEDMGGDAPTPVLVTVYGPLSGTWSVQVGDATITMTHDLAYDEWVIIDTRRMTVLGRRGEELGGKVSRRTYLSDVKLKPGASEVIFNGTDPTGTASCTVSWRPAFYGF